MNAESNKIHIWPNIITLYHKYNINENQRMILLPINDHVSIGYVCSVLLEFPYAIVISLTSSKIQL